MNLTERQRIINFYLIMMVCFLQIVDNAARNEHWNLGNLSMIKNAVLALYLFFALFEMRQFREFGKELVFKDEMISIVYLVMVFTALSLLFMLKNGEFQLKTVEGLVRMLVPVIIGMAVVNMMSLDDIYRIMSFFLCAAVAAYLFCISDKISLENIRSISYSASYSPFESSFFTPASIACCIFFFYYRKNKFYTILSLVFNIMTFKRFLVLYAVFLFLFGKKLARSREVPLWMIKGFEIFFFLLFILYFNLMAGNYDDWFASIFGKSVQSFSMGRSRRLRVLLARGFQSTGFCSSTSLAYVIGMEMDFPMIYLEMGAWAVIAAVHYITKLAKRNWYNFSIVILCLIQMLTSHWLDIVYFWLMTYITIGCIAYKESQEDYRGKQKIRFHWGRKRGAAV